MRFPAPPETWPSSSQAPASAKPQVPQVQPVEISELQDQNAARAERIVEIEAELTAIAVRQVSEARGIDETMLDFYGVKPKDNL